MTLTAKYHGTCRECGEPIVPGQFIDWDKATKRTVHLDCVRRMDRSRSEAKAARATTTPETGAPKATTPEPAPIEVDFVGRHRNHGPAVGSTFRTRRGELVTVVRLSSRFVGQDEVDDQDDFANAGDPYWLVIAHCRPATDDEAAVVVAREAEAKAEAEAETRLGEIARMIETAGERPEAEGGIVVEGETLRDSFDPYGGGERFVVAADGIWHIRNNGTDGAMWAANNVRTGGAGAIGHRVAYDEALATELRDLATRVAKK
jgi:hypothetical protein